ncbi:hypothetical protein STRTUCAR8_08047 [Streptomyces turgidiscabies Car8]|uniref:Uncharacterized protein n=1 Tax=Streptomyces turgidiscabies (strain Car8) TaxID=698760 RepID=L7F502_STRT8|nr:hypothetical protein STRTUCAR8_08047 [Streptomyces turgidiscabies Car8]
MCFLRCGQHSMLSATGLRIAAPGARSGRVVRIRPTGQSAALAGTGT